MDLWRLVLLLVAAVALPAAELRLAGLFSDHAVLQRGRAVPVWGWADPGVAVEASLAGATASAVAGADGRFLLHLPALPAGGPHRLEVGTGAGARRTVEDLLVGEVWLCAGQSNMGMPLSLAEGSAAAIAAAELPRLRLFQVPRQVLAAPVADVRAAWRVCTPGVVGGFSATGFFFGRELLRDLAVPVGLIQVAWGGTPAEVWTPLTALAADPSIRVLAERWRDAPHPADRATYAAAMRDWKERGGFFDDPGLAPAAAGWMAPDLPDDPAWRPAVLPTTFAAINGGVWFHRQVAIPAAWAGRALTLQLGAIDDTDIAWYDGHEVGRTGRETESWYVAHRLYTVPAALVRAGRAVITLRVWDGGLTGGFTGVAEQFSLGPADMPACGLSLAGTWSRRDELTRPEPADPMPADPGALHQAPGHLWHSLVQPLVPYALAGVVWYQGESNVSRAVQYRHLLSALIGSWREAWGQGDLPFLLVGLAGYRQPAVQPHDCDWAELREAQALTALVQRQVGIAQAWDLGDAVDIHPRRKAEVGRRLALQALRRTYGRALVADGPQLATCTIDGAEVRLRFTCPDGGLATSDGRPPRGFALAGADRTFRWADQARIEGDTVVLRATGVPAPVAVRHAWDANPETNLMGAAGLPVAPFRSDGWPGVTDSRD